MLSQLLSKCLKDGSRSLIANMHPNTPPEKQRVKPSRDGWLTSPARECWAWLELQSGCGLLVE